MAHRGTYILTTLILTSCGGKSSDDSPGTTAGHASVGGSSHLTRSAGAQSTTAGTDGSFTSGGRSYSSGGAVGIGGTHLTAIGGLRTADGASTSVGGKTSLTSGGTRVALGGASVSTGGSSVVMSSGGSLVNTTGGAPSATGGANSTAAGGTQLGIGGTGFSGGTGATTVGGTNAALGGACPRASNVLSDFESGKGIVDTPFIDSLEGYWYVYRDRSECMSAAQTPNAVDYAAVDAELLPTTDTRYSACNRYAMHSSITGCRTYSGFGAVLAQYNMSDALNMDVSEYDGVSLWIKAGSGAQGPIFLEILSKNCVAPPPDGGGTATSEAVDRFNCHGRLFKKLSTEWQHVFVPFGTMGPRWIPSPYPVRGLATCASTEFCEGPPLDTKNVLGIQLSLEDPWTKYPDDSRNYDVWVDDVALYKFSDQPLNQGLSTWTQSGKYNFPQNTEYPFCSKPGSADGRLIQDAFVNWKSQFVKGEGGYLRVMSPESDTGHGTAGTTMISLSAGIAYGMLIAVYMDDRDLFDGLLGYWKANAVPQTVLMKSQIGGYAANSGSATDADEDAAFALQMATKQWGDTYRADATAILSQFLTSDVDSDGYLKGGSAYDSGYDLWNPSYFAPAYYRYFATIDTAHADMWNKLVTNGYQQLANITGDYGLVPAWCTSSAGGSCTSRGGTGGYSGDLFDYDAHRTPWRIGLDECWNGSTDAKAYLDKFAKFFAARSDSGLSSMGDVYDEHGSRDSDSIYNSMSLIGCAAVGTMSVANTAVLRDRSWNYLLNAQYTMNPGFRVGTTAGRPMYTYHNATVGLLAMLTLSGNFYLM